MEQIVDDTGNVILAEMATLSSSYSCPRMARLVMTGAPITPTISTAPIPITVGLDPIPVVYATRPVQAVRASASIRPTVTMKRAFMRTWRRPGRSVGRAPRGCHTRRVASGGRRALLQRGDGDPPPARERRRLHQELGGAA